MAANEFKTIRISKSIIFKSIVLLILSMSLIVIAGTAFFTQRQLSLIFEWSHNNNSSLLQQASMSAHTRDAAIRQHPRVTRQDICHPEHDSRHGGQLSQELQHFILVHFRRNGIAF
jgi:hypothetical protein